MNNITEVGKEELHYLLKNLELNENRDKSNSLDSIKNSFLVYDI